MWALRSTPEERVTKLRSVFSSSFLQPSAHLMCAFDEFVVSRNDKMVNIGEDLTPEKEDFLTKFAVPLKFKETFISDLYQMVRPCYTEVCYRHCMF